MFSSSLLFSLRLIVGYLGLEPGDPFPIYRRKPQFRPPDAVLNPKDTVDPDDNIDTSIDEVKEPSIIPTSELDTHDYHHDSNDLTTETSSTLPPEKLISTNK